MSNIEINVDDFDVVTLDAGNQSTTGFVETDPTVPAWAKHPKKPTYTAEEVGAMPADTKIITLEQLQEVEEKIPTDVVTSEQLSAVEEKIPTDTVTAEELRAVENKIPDSPNDIGAEPAGTAETAVSTHNTATDAHNDIRLLIEGLTTRLNTIANSTDVDLDQLAEIVAYIKNNKSLIDGITTSKVNVTDIIDNLTTNVANKPLSAAQGVALKALIEAIPEVIEQVQSDLSETNEESKAYIKGALQERHIPNGIPKLLSAEAGQTIVVKAVDENGVPTEWEAVPMAESVSDERIQINIKEYVINNPSEAIAFSSTEKYLILTLFKNTAFINENMERVITALETSFNEDEEQDPNKTYFSITSNLTNITSSNAQTSVEQGTAYITTLSATDDYVVGNVNITMGGVDITSTSYADGVISISNVTGNIVITATALSAIVFDYVNGSNTVDNSIHADGTVGQYAGWAISELIDISGYNGNKLIVEDVAGYDYNGIVISYVSFYNGSKFMNGVTPADYYTDTLIAGDSSSGYYYNGEISIPENATHIIVSVSTGAGARETNTIVKVM